MRIATCLKCGTDFQCSPSARGKYCSKACTIGFNRRHGLSDNPEHRTWTRIRERCNNPNHGDYARYGGRGIKVCERWNVFENFLADMGPRSGRTIDRYPNNDGDYEPGNCRWATMKEQANNRGGYNYSPEDDQKIREALARGYSHRETAEYVGKSFASVTARIYRLGLRSSKARTLAVVGSPAQQGGKNA